MSTPDRLPIGTRVRLAAYGATRTDTAVVVATGPCPERGCPQPAVTVRREPGSFTSWYGDVGYWHAAQAEPVVDGREA